MKTYLIVYFDTLGTSHQVYKIVDENHDSAILAAYKKFNPDWKNNDEGSKAIKEDFYFNSEVVAIIDAPSNKVVLAYKTLVYQMPQINPEEL